MRSTLPNKGHTMKQKMQQILDQAIHEGDLNQVIRALPTADVNSAYQDNYPLLLAVDLLSVAVANKQNPKINNYISIIDHLLSIDGIKVNISTARQKPA